MKDLFSNFLDKSPDSLFRRIDPDYHYPTFGDDSVVEELAPTMGKMYVKVSHDESHALWGNFKIGYLENELAQVDRGLYGGNAHWQSDATTDFGEQRVALDAFAAQPGTVGEPRRVQRHRRVALLPAQPGHSRPAPSVPASSCGTRTPGSSPGS